jgi:hypothetical protein
MGGHAHRVSAIPVAGHALIGFLRRCPAKIRFRYFTSTRSIRLGSSAGARELFTRLDTGHPHQHQHPQLKPGARIGVWCATKLATDAGGWRQINRGGHPMMWPIFWPDDTHFSIPADTRHPSQDFAQEGAHIAEHIAAVVAASGTSGDPHGYGQTVARELFPDVLPYVVGTPATYGFATRNGRTMADNAPEVMLSLVSGKAVPSGLTPSVTKNQRHDKFPYVVPA